MNKKLIEWLEERIQSLEDLAEFLPSGDRGEIQRIEYEGMKQAYRLTIMKLKRPKRNWPVMRKSIVLFIYNRV